MRPPSRRQRLGFAAALLIVSLSGLGSVARAHPSFFSGSCAGCHSNDTQTCNGCHNHVSTLTATASRASYFPGESVMVSLAGGSERGWIRALLYDHNSAQIDRKSGPTGTGDDGLPNPLVFPVALSGTAPALPGNYTWQAAWFGNTGNGGSVHGEVRTSVVIHVVPAAVARSTWDGIKGLYR